MKPRQAAWNSFSKYIRAKAPYCEFHARLWPHVPEIKRCVLCHTALQCCHKITRAKSSLLFDERNCFSGCSSSNVWAHWNQVEWDVLWRKMWPEDVEYLDSRKDIIVHRKSVDYLKIAAYYKSKLKELEAK